jgi:hypothetical protein
MFYDMIDVVLYCYGYTLGLWQLLGLVYVWSG